MISRSNGSNQGLICYLFTLFSNVQFTISSYSTRDIPVGVSLYLYGSGTKYLRGIFRVITADVLLSYRRCTVIYIEFEFLSPHSQH